jgi:predicted ABC-type ATPase
LRNFPFYPKSLSDTPKILILAGPNGAGKTTFAREFVRKELGFKHFVNADLIAAGMSPFDPELASIAAGRVMLDHIAHLVKARESFVIETTLSGLGYARHIKEWKKIGYKISLTFLSLPSETIAVNRVKNRVKQGGHNIPTHVIKRRFLAGRENFNKIYKDLVDQWVLFDNTGEIPIILDRKGGNNA